MTFVSLLTRYGRWLAAGIALALATCSTGYGMGPIRQVFPPTMLFNASGVIETRTVELGSPAYLGVGVAGDLPMSYQWLKNGIAIRGAAGSVTMLSAAGYGGPPTSSASLTLPHVQLSDAGDYQVVFENKWGKTTSPRLALSVVLPEPAVIISQPTSRQIYIGEPVTLNVEAKGSTLRYQWERNGVAIAAATNARYTLTGATVSDAGAYTVLVRGGGIEVRSETATLSVTAPTKPVVLVHPVSQQVAAESAVVFRAAVADFTSCQWQRNGVPLPGATSTSLVIYEVSAGTAGKYALVATNRAGSTTSESAVLTVVPNPTDAGRITNISVLTSLDAAETLTLGTVFNNAYGSGSRPLLVRAAGPSLASLGLGGAMRDPTMTLRDANSGARVASNDDWAGASALRNAFQAVGAFPFADNNTKDAAIFQSALPVGSYLVEIKDAASAGGRVLAELYDAGGTSVSALTPRLLNVSVSKRVSAESPLTTGFFVSGPCSITLLIRAVGPTLAAAPFGLAEAMPDPLLTIFDHRSQVVASNDNWNGDNGMVAAASRVGAFGLAASTSKDAVLVVTVPPGSYTAQVGPADGTAGGTALVEIYELR